MLKKILILLCALAMFGSLAVGTTYAAEDIEQKTEILQQLGVYVNDATTHDKFINSLAGYLYENPSNMGGSESIARSTKMIGEDESYDGEQRLTVNQALKYAVVALGYQILAENAGGFPEGYLQYATNLGLTQGLTESGEEAITKESAVNLLYNMLEVEPVLLSYIGGSNSEYVIADGKTLLSENRDIYKVKGLMTSTELTSIYGSSYTARLDHIIIDGVLYHTESNDFDKFLGKNVIAYVQKTESGDYDVLYGYENESKNKTLIINRDDVTAVGNSISTITYEETENKEKTIDIVASPRVIYNGMFIVDYTVADFKADNGILELIDYDKNGTYDVIKVTAYETMVVESVDTKNLIITNKYKFTGCLANVDLDYRTEAFRIYNNKGAEVSISNIVNGSVLNVAKSKDGKIINVYVSGTAAVNGTVTGMYDEDDLYVIDGTEYKISDDFRSFLAGASKTIELGKAYTFYIDYFGRIAYMREQVSNDYVLLLKVIEDMDECKYVATYMDMAGEWHSMPLASRVTIDEAVYSSANAAYNAIRADEPQVVILKTNSREEVTKIDKAATYNEGVKQFSKIPETRYMYRIEPRFFLLSNKAFHLEADAKVIIVPTTDKLSKESWEIRSTNGFFTGGKQYDVTLYDPDEYGFVKLVLIKQTPDLASLRLNRNPFIITKITQTVLDGEAVSAIKCNVGVFRNLDFYGIDTTTFNAYQVGDVVNLGFDRYGRVNEVVKVVSLANFTPTFSTLYSSNAVNAGTITSIDLDAGRMMLDCGSVQMPVLITPTQVVTVFSLSERTSETKTAGILAVGNKVLLSMTYGKITNAICVRD